MRTRTLAGLALTLSLSGCPANNGTQPKPATPGTTGASKAPGASSAPTNAAPPAFLKPSNEASVTLSGQVGLEAHFATNTGAGSGLIGNDGAGFLGMGGAQLIGNAGGTLIGNDGATLVAGGRIVASGGGNVIVPAGLIGNAGGTLIGNDGATLIGQDGAGYNLLASGPSPAFGEVWNAAGMWLSVTDSRTGRTVPLGLDAEGKPVYTVYTNAQGKFEVQVPKEVAEFARVVVRPPDRLDSRLVISVPATLANGGPIKVNEDVAAATDLLRYIIASMLIDGIEHPPDLTAPTGDDPIFNLKRELFKIPTFKALVELGNKHNVKAYPKERKVGLGLLLADVIVGNKLNDFELKTQNLLKRTSKVNLLTREAEAYVGKPATPAFVEVMEAFHRKVEAQVKAHNNDPSFLNARPYVVEANLRRKAAGQPLYCIQRVADLQELMVQEFFASLEDNKGNKAVDVLMDLGVEPLYIDIVKMVGEGVTERLALTVPQSIDDALLDNITDVIETYAAYMATQQTQPTPAAACEASLPQEPPAEPARVVETLAGRGPGAPGAEDGAGNLAGFNAPSDIVIAPDNPKVLYVADTGNHKIRRIVLDEAGNATVDTIAGDGVSGYWDGPANRARFNSPQHLAIDAQGNLYVAATSALRQIVFKDGQPASTRTLLAHESVSQYLSTKPADFQPGGLFGGVAVGPDRNLYMMDESKNMLLRLPLPVEGQTPTVERIMGNGSFSRYEGTREQIMLNFPRDVAFGPDQSLWMLSGLGVRRLPNFDDPTSRSYLVAGGFKSAGDMDGFWGDAWFANNMDIEPLADGSVVVVDEAANRIRRVWPEGWARTIAGGGVTSQNAEGNFMAPPGYQDGPAGEARFNKPRGVAAAPDGTLYVTDALNNVIRRIRPR